MFKYAMSTFCAIALLVCAGTARANFHLWQLNEIYSNADGTVQFIELTTGAGGQQFLTGHTITSSQGATAHSFTFLTDLPGDTFGKAFLIGTTGFAALGLVTPDYIVPNGFLFTTNGSVNFAGVDSVSWAALPVDGITSIDRNGATGINSPMNFAGANGSVPALPPPTCTLTASASTINLGGSVILTATCSPAATSYTWTPAAGLVAGPANSATVTPTAVGVYQYSVTGSNAGGAGNTASTSVTVTVAPFISQSDCLFNWAERNYANFFAPAGASSNTLAPYYYRFYLQTNAYLGTSSADSHVYYLGPLSNNLILDVGALSVWLSTAGCQ